MPPRDAEVTVVTTVSAEYGACVPVSAPELGAAQMTLAEDAVRRLFQHAGLDASHRGASGWNPLADIVPRGSRVLIKPNWVSHRNYGRDGLECVVTHTAIVEAVLKYVLLADPAAVTIADAPVQVCDFDVLRSTIGLDSLVRYSEPARPVRVLDLRTCVLDTSRSKRSQTCRQPVYYREIDLGTASALEPVSKDAAFRVTMYDPTEMVRTHRPGTHKYLVAREALDADVILSIPKLKTHRKVGLTGALKNVVGVNGKKEYLPHHRAGDPSHRGDCYPRSSTANRVAEWFRDQVNVSQRRSRAAAFETAARICAHVPVLSDPVGRLEGSWDGNDTAWRMVLDLVKIVRMADRDGQLRDTPQRSLFSVTDAIVAGEGEGPLAPSPAPLRFLTFGANPAACDWVHAAIVGWNPADIPLIRNAIGSGPFAAFRGREQDISINVNGEPAGMPQLSRMSRTLRPPRYWHVDRRAAQTI